MKEFNGIKVTEKQRQIIELMKDGYSLIEMRLSGCMYLQKGQQGCGVKTINVNKNYVNSLINKNIIKYTRSNYRIYFYLNTEASK